MGRVKTAKTQAFSKPRSAPEVNHEKHTAGHLEKKKSHKLIIEQGPIWHEAASVLKAPATSLSLPDNKVTDLFRKAETLHAQEVSSFSSSLGTNALVSSSSDMTFLKQILSSGTLSDRLSALTLMVQSSPVHNTKALESLRAMGQKKGREESLKALRAIVDWWVGGGAPNRKLRFFREQPLSHESVSDKHLVLWYFEDWLKKYFFSILQTLETLSLDPLPYVKMQAISLILTLLREKPEQEQNLLRLLVNKLGDTERPVTSRASHHILQLVQTHPQMKPVVIREVSALIFRQQSTQKAKSSTATHLKFTDDSKEPSQSAKIEKKSAQRDNARYYGAISLNQFLLSPEERTVALQLVNVYFELFEELLGERAEKDADSVTGNKVEAKSMGRHDKKAKDGKGKGKAVVGDAGFAEVEDSDSKLISAILTGINRAMPFAKLNAKDESLAKHIDTLFTITHKSTFNISLQALRLILQISQSLQEAPSTLPSDTESSELAKAVISRYYRTLYASLQDSRLGVSNKQAMYLNLLFKSIKADRNLDRVKAFIRRFVQFLASGATGGAEFAAGGLYLLGVLFSTVNGLREMLEGLSTSLGKEDAESSSYDPRKRDPQYADAGSSPLWEFLPLLSHYHPAVRLHAHQLLDGQALTANVDLSLNTLSHFLDRFVYKNPKKVKPKGASAMQPAATPADGTTIKLLKNAADKGAVNPINFKQGSTGRVPVDQLFLQKYFVEKDKRNKAKASKVAKRKPGEDDGSDEEVSDDEEGRADEEGNEDDNADEAEIWKAMKTSMPQIEDDNLPSELEDSDASDDEGPDNDSDNDTDGVIFQGSESDEVDSDADISIEGLIDYESGSDASEDEEEEWLGIGQSAQKRPRDSATSGKPKKKLRALPTFASYEDYEKMIDATPEDMI